jgi:APA family basic amino acid/polyamine antiporter
MDLFRTKSIDAIVGEAERQSGLKRVLGPANLVSLGIGAIIGTGIFVLTGQAAAMHAGPAIVISMVVAGVVSALAGLCYAELAATVPVAGSAYTYSYATLGEFVAWIIGWDLVLEYALGAATVAVGWSAYFTSLLNDLGLPFPAIVSAAPGTVLAAADGTTVTAIFNLPAVIIALLVTALLVRGVHESATVNGIMVIVKVTVVLLVIVAGVAFVDSTRFTPLIPPNTGTFGEFGISGIMRGAAVIFFAYIGFDAVSTAAQEARNPRRDMPIGILGSLVICTVLYIAVAAVMVGLVPYGQLDGPAPMAVTIGYARAAAQGTALEGLLNVMPLLVKLGILAGLSSTIVVQMMAQPRIFMAMSRDGLLPPWMGRVHPRLGSPYLTTIATGGVVALAAGLTPIALLGHMVSIGTLFAFVVVSVGVLVLRRTQPDLARPFKAPWSPFVPAASALVSLALMLSLPGETWTRLFLWMAVGIVIYFIYSARRSNLAMPVLPRNRAGLGEQP